MTAKRWKVLLVDDEQSIIKMVGKRLELEGFDVIVALDGAEALVKANTEHPDLIVLDLMLPKISGLEICAELKQHQASKEIPVITIFSGRGSPDDEAKCLQLGAAAYVAKGHGAGPLVDQIKALLGSP